MRYVFFHGNCFDGFGAAYAAWAKFGDSAKYIPQTHGQETILDIPYKEKDEVYVVDFSISNEVFEKLDEKVAKIVILDHHRTALDRFTELTPYPEDFFTFSDGKNQVIFDMNKSGALISWEYFHPDHPAPQLIQWISDRDLWTFNIPGTKEAHAFLASKEKEFEGWENYRLLAATNPQSIVDTGKSLLELEEQVVAMICKKAYVTKIKGHTVPIVNATSHWSEVGHRLLDIYPFASFAASYTDQPDGTRMFSLRSRNDEDFDVSEIAKMFNGGGHKHAAGFKIPIELHLTTLE
jgi:uncharacterized protein